MFMVYAFRYILLLSFLFKCKCDDSDGLNQIILNKYDYELNVSKFDLTVLNLNKELYDMKYSLMAYINDTNLDENIFKSYTPFYNHFWLFYISDMKIFNEILFNSKYSNDYMKIFGIIVPKSLKNKIVKNLNRILPSIFYIDDNLTGNLEDSDFRINDKITYFSINTEKPISRYPEKYFQIFSLILFCISGTIIMIWYLMYKVSKKKDITQIQKYCNIFPILNFFLSVVLTIKCLYIKGKDPYLHYEYMETIDTIFISLNAFFKISISILLIMFSTGWNIAIRTISRKTIIYYFKMGAFAFFFQSLDILIYNFNEKSYNKYSEIINIIFTIIITILMLKKIKSTIKLLYKKLYYAQTLIPKFIEGLLFKLKIFSKVKAMIITYPFANIILFLIHNFIPDKYVSICLKFIHYYFLNLVFLIILLIILRPKSLPKNYDVDFAKDLEDDPGKIYKINISLNSEGEVIYNDLTPKEIIKMKKKKYPIIILGPIQTNNENNSFNYNNNIYINSDDDEKDINLLYKNLKIGFID